MSGCARTVTGMACGNSDALPLVHAFDMKPQLDRLVAEYFDRSDLCQLFPCLTVVGKGGSSSTRGQLRFFRRNRELDVSLHAYPNFWETPYYTCSVISDPS